MATKLFVPRVRRRLVVRERLSERLDDAADARLVLLSAPAGFGKTTLLANWLENATHHGRAVAWLSLEASDDDPGRFWSYVVTALAAALPSNELEAVQQAAADPAATQQVLTELINELARAPVDVWLVLDDFHAVQSSSIHDGLAFLLDRMLAHVHIVLSTRADPHLPLARWRARGELVEIRAADLRFTPDESCSFLLDVEGLELSGADVAALGERTEGWAAALQLASLSLEGRHDPSAFIARFAGNNRYVVDYLVDEVLAHQPVEVRDFLVRTSVLDRLTGPLCDAVTGGSDGDGMLISLERAGLFLFPLDDERVWYRYHHLFADVLRARLNQQDVGADANLLHQRASRWHEQYGGVEDSVSHALAGRDLDRATSLMERALPGIRRHRQDSVLLGWLAALPRDSVRTSPVLSVFDGWAHMLTGDLDAAEHRLDDAEQALATAPDDARSRWAKTDELSALPATIAVYRAALAQARGDVAQTSVHAQRALEIAGPEDHLSVGAATGFLGLASWAAGDVGAALPRFADAVASLRAAGNLADALDSTVVLADMWLTAGHVSHARRLCEESLAVATGHGLPMARTAAVLHVQLAGIDCEADDLASAGQHLASADTLVDDVFVTASQYRWFLTQGQVRRAEGDLVAALTLVDRAQQVYRPGFYVDVRPIPAIRARLWITQGDLARASGWAQERDWSTSDTGDFLLEFDHLTYVRLLLARSRAGSAAVLLDEAAQLLARLLEPARTSGRWAIVAEIHMLTALILDAQDLRTEALSALADAFAEPPEPDGYTRLFLDEGDPIRKLLRDARQLGVADGHPSRLLAEPDRPAPHQALVDQTLLDPLSERELQVLRLLDSELSAPEIARRLFVSHNTVRTHTRHIFTKLQVTSRRAAVHRAHEHRLI
jgi:LuxR family transcriptional regulator, maltose regulon positive regulatory protein